MLNTGTTSVIRNLSGGYVSNTDAPNLARIAGSLDSSIGRSNVSGYQSANWGSDPSSSGIEDPRNSFTPLAYTPDDIRNRTTIKTRKTATAIRGGQFNSVSGVFDSGYPQTSNDTSSTAIASDDISNITYKYESDIINTGV
jgi:hypothetical protein